MLKPATGASCCFRLEFWLHFGSRLVLNYFLSFKFSSLTFLLTLFMFRDHLNCFHLNIFFHAKFSSTCFNLIQLNYWRKLSVFPTEYLKSIINRRDFSETFYILFFNPQAVFVARLDKQKELFCSFDFSRIRFEAVLITSWTVARNLSDHSSYTLSVNWKFTR